MSTASLPFACSCDNTPTPGVSWWRILVGAFLAVNSMALAIAVNTSDVDHSERITLQAITLAVTIIVTALLGWPLAVSSFAALKRRQITIEALFLLSYLGAGAASFISMFTGHGPVFWEVAGILLVVYSLGRAVGRYSQQRVLQALASWDPRTTNCQRITPSGTIEITPIADIQTGDLIRVHPGHGILVDGVVERGRAFVREADMTGEAFAAARSEGDSVYAGTAVLDATLDIRATTAGTERQIDRIAAALESLNRRPAPSQIMADRIMRWFVPVLLLIATGTFAFWYTRSGSSTALFNAMAVLLVACPCALGFATPISVWSGMGRLGALGLIAKNGAAIEKLAALDTIVFDKTGTLTLAGLYRAELTMLPTSPLDEPALRTLIATLESHSDHPIASALTGLGTPDPAIEIDQLRIIPGVGLWGRSPACQIQIGVSSRGSDDRLTVLIDDTPAALIRLHEEITPGVTTTITALQHSGLECILMTGDISTRASRIPIASQHSSLTPDDKLQLCRSIEASGKRIAFIGDGLNDAAAMSASAVSIAVESGAALVRDVADIIWTRFDIRDLPKAIAISRDTVRSLRGAIRLALAYNAVGIVLAAAGLLHPVVASLLMTCSSLIVTWRSVSLLEAK